MSDDPGLPGSGPEPAAPAPGWYVDGTGVTRWWDGTQWGEAAPAAAAPTPAAPVPPPTPGAGWTAPVDPTAVGGYPTPAAQPYTGPAVAVLDPGVALSYGWKKFQEYAKEFIVMVVVVALVSLVGVLVAFLGLLPAVSGNSTGAAIGFVLFGLALVLSMAISLIVQAGVYRAGLGVTQGIPPSLKMLVDTTNLGTYVGTVLLVALGYFVGFLLCVLPGLAVLFFTAYAPLIALDKGVGPVEAIKGSIDLVKNNLGPVFLTLLLSYAVYYIGSLACYVGLVVSIPVALVMITYSYRALSNEAVTP